MRSASHGVSRDVAEDAGDVVRGRPRDLLPTQADSRHTIRPSDHELHIDGIARSRDDLRAIAHHRVAAAGDRQPVGERHDFFDFHSNLRGASGLSAGLRGKEARGAPPRLGTAAIFASRGERAEKDQHQLSRNEIWHRVGSRPARRPGEWTAIREGVAGMSRKTSSGRLGPRSGGPAIPERFTTPVSPVRPAWTGLTGVPRTAGETDIIDN
jgi:hypothetical protein